MRFEWSCSGKVQTGLDRMTVRKRLYGHIGEIRQHEEDIIAWRLTFPGTINKKG